MGYGIATISNQKSVIIFFIALEFLRRCEHVSGTFFQLEKHTTELFSDSTYTERHSVISACIGSYEGLEVTFLRTQQEERDDAAAVDRILETIKSSPSTGPRRLTRKERLDSARNTLLYRMLETDIQLFYVSVKLVLDRSAETAPLEALLGDIRTYLAEFVQFLKANLDKSTLPRKTCGN